jgi:hypothetical protein
VGLSFEFVIRQSPALNLDSLVSSSEIAVNTLLLADACDIDGNDYKNPPAVKNGFDFSGTTDDGLIQLATQSKSFAPKKGCEVRCHHGSKRGERSGPRVREVCDLLASDLVAIGKHKPPSLNDTLGLHLGL